MATIITTNCFVQKEGMLLLGLKKRGFGANRWNGFGGKPQAGESLEDCARRELFEECGIEPLDIRPIGELLFTYAGKPDDILVYFYKITEFIGQPVETEEMRPQWFPLTDLPLVDMWPDDEFWLPLFIQGKKFKGVFNFEGYDRIVSHKLGEV